MEHCNRVEIVGKLSFVGEERPLPSGDRLVALRVVVPRAAKGKSKSKTVVDAIDAACWNASLRRKALRLVVGDQVRLEGSLRRHFFRGAGGAASRYEVEVRMLERVASPSATSSVLP